MQSLGEGSQDRLTDKLAELVGQEHTGDEKRNERGEVCLALRTAISNNLDVS